MRTVRPPPVVRRLGLALLLAASLLTGAARVATAGEKAHAAPSPSTGSSAAPPASPAQATPSPAAASPTASPAPVSATAVDTAHPGPPVPNLLVLVADDVGADKIGSYAEDFRGYRDRAPDLPATPNVDRLARSGLRFSQAWANPLCSPTRSTLQTGRYGFRTGVGSTVPEGPALRRDETTIAQVLAKAGYATGLFGKWHLGPAGVHGTEDWRLLPGEATRTIPDGAAPLAFGWQTYDGYLGGRIEDYRQWTRTRSSSNDASVLTRETAYPTDVQTDAALAWIRQQRGPWLAMVTYVAAHSDGDDRDHEPDDVGATCPSRPRAATPIAAYAAVVTCLDDRVGKLLDAIPPAVLANTVVVFLGDNGTEGSVTERALAPSRRPGFGKGTSYETGVHVPLVIASGRAWACTKGDCPGDALVSGPGRVVTAPVGLIDLPATLAALGHADMPTAVDSVSLLPCLRNDPACDAPRRVYTETFRYRGGAGEFDQPTPTTFEQANAALRYGKDKLLVRWVPRDDCFRTELFDLATDPGEENDVAHDDPAAFARLSAMLRDLDPPWMKTLTPCRPVRRGAARRG